MSKISVDVLETRDGTKTVNVVDMATQGELDTQMQLVYAAMDDLDAASTANKDAAIEHTLRLGLTPSTLL